MKTEPGSRPSVALNLLQLYITFHVRIRRGLHKPLSETRLNGRREQLEDLALASLDKKLSRQNTSALLKNSISHDQPKYTLGNRDVSVESSGRSTVSTCAAASCDRLHSATSDLEKYTRFQGTSLARLAADDRVFLTAQPELLFQKHSWFEIFRMVALTNETIASLHRVVSRYTSKGLAQEQGTASRLNISDEKFVANLKHLLLRIRGALLAILVRKSIDIAEEQVSSWEHYWTRKKLAQSDWYSEWPSGRRPLSTCWPWNIRPSLVVLWGVCWKFFDTPYHQVQTMDDTPNKVKVPRRALASREELYEFFPRVPPSANTYANFAPTLLAESEDEGKKGRSLQQQIRQPSSAESLHVTSRAGASPQRAPQAQRHQLQPSDLEAGRLPDGTSESPDLLNQARPLHPQERQAKPLSDSDLFLTKDLSDLAQSNFATAGDAAAGTSGLTYNSPAGWVPSTQPAYDAYDSTNFWLPDQYPPPQQFPYLGSAPQDLNAGLRVTPLPPAISIYPPPDPPTATELFAQSLNTFPSHRNFYSNPGGSPDIMPDDAQSSFPSPVASDRSPSPKPTEIRRASITTSTGAQDIISSENESTRTQGDRRGETPRNQNGKIICISSPDCEGLTFERRCEWNKHMDKHERPYLCKEIGCENLRGFTYSGGLLRHQREVHKKFGGPRETFMCPFEDCKRHTGNGFTRKENLTEHVRRMHRPRDDTSTAVNSPAGEMKQPRLKRKRDAPVSGSSTAGSPGGDSLHVPTRDEFNDDDGERSDDLRDQIKRLKRENEDKDRRLQRLEAALLSICPQPELLNQHLQHQFGLQPPMRR